MKKLATGLLLAAAALGMGSATAGAVYTTPIYVTSAYAYGALSAVRHSNDKTQLIGCTAFASTSSSSGYIHCFASDTKGHQLSCVLYNPNWEQWTLVLSMTDSSWVEFFISPSTYECANITVVKASSYIR